MQIREELSILTPSVVSLRSRMKVNGVASFVVFSFQIRRSCATWGVLLGLWRVPRVQMCQLAHLSTLSLHQSKSALEASRGRDELEGSIVETSWGRSSNDRGLTATFRSIVPSRTGGLESTSVRGWAPSSSGHVLLSRFPPLPATPFSPLPAQHRGPRAVPGRGVRTSPVEDVPRCLEFPRRASVRFRGMSDGRSWKRADAIRARKPRGWAHTSLKEHFERRPRQWRVLPHVHGACWPWCWCW